MPIFQKFWVLILWSLYFLQQENYDLVRFWQAIPASIVPKKARQSLVWTKKLILILLSSLGLWSFCLVLLLFSFFRNDLDIVVFYLRDFGNGVNNWMDFIWYLGITWVLSLPLALLLFPFFQSLIYTLVVLMIWPIDSFCKNQITQKAAQKVQKWRQSRL